MTMQSSEAPKIVYLRMEVTESLSDAHSVGTGDTGLVFSPKLDKKKRKIKSYNYLLFLTTFQIATVSHDSSLQTYEVKKAEMKIPHLNHEW